MLGETSYALGCPIDLHVTTQQDETGTATTRAGQNQIITTLCNRHIYTNIFVQIYRLQKHIKHTIHTIEYIRIHTIPSSAW